MIVGFTAPKGSRAATSARCRLADIVNGELAYAGRVGTGFNDALLGRLAHEARADLIREAPPCAPPLGASVIPETKTTTWVEPRYVCEVRYREWTPDGVLRHATLLRMRPDKDPRDCERQGVARPAVEPRPEERSDEGPLDAETESAPRAEILRSAQDDEPTREIKFSNLKKIYWPENGYTKGDLIDYYTAIWPWMSVYLINRPLVMTRFPDGIDGKSFYQKDAPEFAPSWIRTQPIWAEDTQRDINYFVCDNSSRCSTSRISARFPCTSGTAASGRSSCPTGA